jgi:hypothetical protein
MAHDNNIGSISGMRRLRSDGSASVAELREFLGHMRGKNPQEVMGLVAESGLIKSTVVSAVGLLVLLFATSALAYFLKPEKKDTAATPGVAANSAATANNTGEQPAESPADADATAAAADDGVITTKSGDKTLDTLGIGESKISNPDENPLDSKLDSLLDGVK